MRREAGVRAALAVAVGAVVLGAACRDAPDPFDPPGLTELGPPPYRLTYDPGREVAPAWTPDGDSILYVSQERFEREDIMVLVDSPVDSFPVEDTVRSRAVVRVIPRSGGVADLRLPLLQGAAASVAIDYATPSSTGRVAGLTLLPAADRSLCGGVSPCDDDLLDPPARLATAFLRVRDPAAAGPPDADPLLRIDFPGRRFDTSEQPLGLSGLWRVDQHPFQVAFNETSRAPDRVSWSPDGDRLVFSDGVVLRVWNPDTGALDAIPNTSDGTNPAWSPTGEWIAFERAERGAAVEEDCEHRVIPDALGAELGAVICVERRTSWPVTSRTLAVVRPDGSDLRLLPPGARPAWGADGQRIFYESGRQIWSVRIDGSDVAVVPDTEQGWEPAVSPDGTLLAFTRIDGATGAADIWVVEIAP